MQQLTIKTTRTAIATLVMTALYSNSVQAQENETDSIKLETITVTSQKRTQTLKEVPLSVSAMNADKMEKAGITDAEDLSAYIPNFSVSKDSIADKINIRGMQSGNLAGFEQSVGTFVNGIYRGRGVQSRFSFMDVERVEVLRGPQSILFGKNTVAGALNITTAKPDEEFNGRVSLTENITLEQTEMSAMLTGALSDSLRARAFLLSRDMDKGWVENQFYNTDDPQTEETMGRVTLEWDASDNTMVTFLYEGSDFDYGSFPHAMRQAGPLAALGAIEGTEVANIGNTNPVLDFGASQNMIGNSNEATLISETNLTSGTLTVTAGHSAYDFKRNLDADYSPLDALRFSDTEDYEQNSLEIRFASDTKGDFEYMTGLYWQTQDLELSGLSLFNIPFLQNVLLGGCNAGVSALGGSLADIYQAGNVGATGAGVIGLNGPAGLVNTCGTAAAFDGIPVGVGRYAYLDQTTDTLGIFAQGTWQVSDQLSATFGLRHTQESKEASKIGYATDFAVNTTTPTTNPLVTAVAEQVGEFATHSFAPSDPGMTRDENSTTWSLNLKYTSADDSMAYISAGTGFKGGGYNSFYMRSPLRDNTANSNDVAFEEEDVITFEAGYKTSLLNGSADLNLSVFHSTFENMQVSVFSGNTTFEVQNAAEATSYGLELDGRWRATESLTFSGSLGLLSFEFDEFASQACTSNQFLAARQGAFAAAAGNIPQQIGIAMTYNNASCAGAGVNDMQGRTTTNAPDLTASFVASHVTEIADGFDLNTDIDVNHRSEVFRVDDLDPIGRLPAMSFVNASVTLDAYDQGWSVSLIANNLTDKAHFDYINDVPLFPGAHNYMPLQGRTYTLRLNYEFGE